MKTCLITISFLVISSLSFSQIGVGTSISHSEVFNNLSFSLQTSPQKKYGLTTRFGLGLPVTSHTSSLNINPILTRRFYQSEHSSMYLGIGTIYEYKTFKSRFDLNPNLSYNYHNWGLNMPLGIEVFPNAEKKNFSVFLESSLIYMNTHQSGDADPSFNLMPYTERYFGVSGTIGINYFFGGKK